jgi:hypothetical protein
VNNSELAVILANRAEKPQGTRLVIRPCSRNLDFVQNYAIFRAGNKISSSYSGLAHLGIQIWKAPWTDIYPLSGSNFPILTTSTGSWTATSSFGLKQETGAQWMLTTFACILR